MRFAAARVATVASTTSTSSTASSASRTISSGRSTCSSRRLPMAIGASEAVSLLFHPLPVKGLTLKNRVVFPPCVTNFAAEDGSITERSRAYYAARAKGGAALVIVEASYVTPEARAFACNVGNHDDRLVPGLRGLVEGIHAGGAPAPNQLFHPRPPPQPALP